jgi:superfamily II DNA/RNA helicase
MKAEDAELKNAIIFCNRKVEVSELFRSLLKYDFDAGALHGDMDQRARMQMLANFRDGKLRYLVASDVAARGLDIPDVSHVFNYDVPIHAEDYVHRIGRTGRAGRSGKSFTIATKSDTKYIDAIERLIGNKIEWHDGDLSTVVASEGEDETPRRGRGAPRRAGRRDEERKEKGERKPRERHARHEDAAAPETTLEEQPVVAEAAIADIGERRARKEAIRSENTERKTSPDRREQRAQERGDTRPQRDNSRPARHRQEDNDTTVGFGDDMPAFMRIVAKV